MATDLDKVRPGDVITAELMNLIINKLNALDQKVDGLPTGGGTTPGGPPTLNLSFNPSDGQAVGAEVTITGTFDFPPSHNTVAVDDVPVTDFRAGSNLTTLKFLIPTSIIVPPGTTRTVTDRVVNSQGVGENQYVLKEQVQASAPTPTISTVTNDENPAFGTTLQTTKRAAINGTNFSTTLANNTIKFTVPSTTPGTNTIVTVPTQSIVSVSAGGDKLVFNVPDIPLMGSVGTQKNGTLEIAVAGNIVAASKGVTVLRMTPPG